MTEKNNGPNWEEIKVEYVRSDLSVRELAEKYGVNANTLQHHAYEGKWRKLRQSAQKKADEILTKKTAKERAKRMAEYHDVGYDLMQRVKVISAGAKKMTSTRVKTETVTEKHLKKLDVDVPIRATTETDLVRLALMYSGLMRTLGFDEASQIARERLEVDRLKVELMVEADIEQDERPIIIDERPSEEDADAEHS